MAFEKCPKCQAPTKYREDSDGRSLICTRCHWEAMEIEWVATARRYDRIEASRTLRSANSRQEL